MNLKRMPTLSALLILMIAMLACNLIAPPPSTPTANLGGGAGQTPTAAVAATPTATPTDIPIPPTEPPGPDRAPEMRIAYTDAGHNLWMWIDGGSTTEIIGTGDVTEARISPDGHTVVFVRTPNYLNFSMWLVNADGSDERLLISQDQFNAMKNDPDAVGAQPYVWDWVPGTRKLAIVSAPTQDGPGMMVNDDLWYVNIDTGELLQIEPPGQGGVFYFSPDGQQIALVTPKTISLINTDGSNRRQSALEYPLVSTYSEYQYYATPKWSSDSSYLRTAILPQEPLAEPRQQSTVWDISSDGSPARIIGAVTTVPLLGPELSPDLNHIAYVVEHGATADNQRELHIAVADASGNTIYQTGQLDFMGWAPDSRRFIFSSGSDNQAKLGAIGGAAVSFSDVNPVAAVSWLKDGKVIFLHRTSNSWEMRIGTPGGASEVLVSLPGDPSKFMPTFAIYE
jgi:Tol biopolymer transport system component